MLGTWQDVLVTAIAALAAAIVLRPLIPAAWLGRRQSSSPCSSCAAGNACAAVPPVSASATPVIHIQRRTS